jgi:uncharacterized protein (UPF0332 family)
MPVLNADHLLAQARLLIRPPPAGPPRQVDLRRAVSSAYYAVFHTVLTALADEIVGKAHQSTQRYTLVYRTVTHAQLRALCAEAAKPTAPERLRAYLPDMGFGQDLGVFANALTELQKKRHSADYDPSIRFKMSDVSLDIDLARRAIERFYLAEAHQRRAFLYLLAFPPRITN